MNALIFTVSLQNGANEYLVLIRMIGNQQEAYRYNKMKFNIMTVQKMSTEDDTSSTS